MDAPRTPALEFADWLSALDADAVARIKHILRAADGSLASVVS